MSTSLRFKPVDRDAVTRHAVERRGFVNVPLDYASTGQPDTIDIFYRVLPAHDSTAHDATKPFIVVINGGPGISSSFYRPLDFDYSPGAPPPPGLDRFKYLLHTHRVVLVDQRGTDGQSAPLDMDDPALDPALVGRLFSSDSVARDVGAVIDHLIPPGDRFFIIAQSYGGLPGMQYLARPELRQPHGIVFSSSALPFEDPFVNMRHRRREQLRLNLELRQVVPDIATRLDKVRAHCAAVGVDPGIVHGLYTLLGKGVPGVWEPGLVTRLDTILGQSKEQILADVEAGLENPSLLNYILSSVNFTPGQTDRTLAAQGSREIPFEPWMIDEHEMLMSTGQDGTWRQALVEAIDRAPPPPTPFPSLEVLRRGIANTQALFTPAENDAFVPGDAYREVVAGFEVPGHTQVRLLPGGHNAIFLEKGCEAFLEWSRSI
ncbi:MAG: alpha/beta fold hydrolase [Myxococcota bacterium]